MWQTWWAAQGRKQPTYSTHCLIHCPSLQADSASVLLLVVSWVIYNRLAPFLSFYSNHAAFWYPSLITRNNCSQKRVPKSPGDGSEWSTVQLETSLLTFVPFLTSSARNATGGTRKQANKQTKNALFGNRKLLCKHREGLQQHKDLSEAATFLCICSLFLWFLPPLFHLQELAPLLVLVHKALISSHCHPPPSPQERGWGELWEQCLEAFPPRGPFIHMCSWKDWWTSQVQCSTFAECFAWGVLPSFTLSGWLNPD